VWPDDVRIELVAAWKKANPSDATYLIPDEVSYDRAAPIFCAVYTVYSG
jgi:D-arabinose 1-dehydrogenase-like Zn-dependent alcohol dehydrogenase